MINKLRVMGQVGRAIGHIFTGAHLTARFAGKLFKHVHAGFTAKELFKIEIISSTGELLNEFNNQTSSQVVDLMNNMKISGKGSRITVEAQGGNNDN